MRWDEAAARWIVSTNRGDAMRARFVVMANGPLHRPKLPGIPGVETFKGHSFHTSRWDYDYTGGDSDGGLTGLQDKRVGIIGTGATAVQCVPHLGAAAEQLYVFQRTPSSIDVRDNRPTDPEWAASLEPGWQQRRMDNFNTLVSGGFAGRGPGQRRLDRHHRQPPAAGARKTPRPARRVDDPADADAARRLREDGADPRPGRRRSSRDPATAEALKPYYNQFCKRPCFHDEYLDAFNRPNVTLVDTDGQGRRADHRERRRRPTASEYELDCLIYATGFEVGTDYTRRVRLRALSAAAA